MSQKQIQSLELLSLASTDLREAVFKELEENPALVLKNDSYASGSSVSRTNYKGKDYTHVSSSTSAQARLDSDNFQAALEAKPDERISLQEHLLFQLHILNLSEEENALGERLIHNLDDKGFHILAPVTLLDKNSNLDEKKLSSLIKKIQNFDPVGICVKNTEESLYVQAKNSRSLNPEIKPVVLFLLNGHLEFLNPPVTARVQKKLNAYLKDIKNFPQNSEQTAGNDFMLTEKLITEENIQASIEFIKTLEPFPARNFDSSDVNFISPDIYVEKVSELENIKDITEDFSKGLVKQNNCLWNVRLSKDSMPELELSSQFKSAAESLAQASDNSSQTKTGLSPNESHSQSKDNLSSKEKKVISTSIKKATDFMDMLKFRQSTIQKACCYLVKIQSEFFEKGPGHLVPMKQSDLAEKLSVHDTTVSRMANGKYIQCEWGLFEIKYFFSNAVTYKAAGKASVNSVNTENTEKSTGGSTTISDTLGNSSGNAISREKTLFVIKEILEEHKNDSKKLSDQKLCDLLSEKGIMIARRTVAKYRSQLNIESSYNR